MNHMKTYRAVYQDECLYRFMTFDAPRQELAIEQLLLGKRVEETMIGIIEGNDLWEWSENQNNVLTLATTKLAKKIMILAGPVH